MSSHKLKIGKLKGYVMKRIWIENRATINGWLSIGSAFVAEIMAEQGYDCLTIDMQHGVLGYESAVSMLQAMRASAVFPMIRVPWLSPDAIMSALDAGAYGIVCPMVNTRDDAERLVSYVKYPPAGLRSFGPTRAGLSNVQGYRERADEEIVCFAMIETRQALDALDDIVSVGGLDGIYVGPADLTISLFGSQFPPGFDRTEPEMIDAIRQICDQAHGHGKRAGLHCGTPEYAARAVEWGFDLVTVSNDVRLLSNAARSSLIQALDRINEASPSTSAMPSSY
ncbi:HpcH/HpaI aldolase family protein [Phyllobacterium chamaecytisi]|uniref:HpcH/HpaI aldolase family protein n=1 Tax=Phyllobacterium chamaecytisi TaxID=2876082 RepID=UPI001CD001D2|nr:aldolase/citrate lyase family protein [Phyllobacterium sp. KW56]MBZ9603147.1 2,4-dihydroxyhept-2-ene-1,7-dioic acid aldolase [Phyllobacterium sp. KW56]